MVQPIATRASAAKAGLWSALDLALRQGLQFFVSVVLARLLTPADFGVIAIVSFFTSLSGIFIQGGFATALIQRADPTHEEQTAIFWLGLALSAAMAAALYVSGDVIARFYNQPLLAPLMIVAGVQIVLSALGSVHSALLARDLRFDLTMISGIFASVISGTVGLAAAFAGFGIWALAAQACTAAFIGTISLWVFSPWRPAWRFSPTVLKPLLGFGTWISLSGVLEIIYTQGSALLVGKLYGVQDLGFYNRAASTQQLPSMTLYSVIGRITLPLFAARIDEPEAVRRGLRTAIGLVMLVNVPAMIGISLLADPIVTTLFGDKWKAAAPILSILAIGGLLYPMHALNLQALLAHGGSARFFRIEVIKKLMGVGFVLVGTIYGVEGLAWAQVVLSVVAFHFNAAPMGQRVGYGTTAQIRDLGQFVIPTLLMSTVVLLIVHLVLWPVMILPLAVLSGGITYILACYMLKVRAFADALDLVTDMVRQRKGRRAADPVQRSNSTHDEGLF